MALSGLGLFLLEACAGTASLLLFFPPGVLGRGFFTLHGGAGDGLCGALALGPADGPAHRLDRRRDGSSRDLHARRARRMGRARRAILLAAGAAASFWSLARVALVAPVEQGNAWTVVGAIAGGLFFGAVLLIMNLGHWYLVSRSLPFRLLARGAALFAGLAIFRTVYLAVAVAEPPRPPRACTRSCRSSATRSSSCSACSGASSVRWLCRTSSGGRRR